MGGFLATVLICDDEPALRELVRVSLDDGYEIVEADNGNSCLSAVREHRPDLVVLDLMMPQRHGLDVLDDMRADGDLARTPVIVLTAQPSAGDDALRRGATRVLEKPFDPEQINAAVEEVLTEHRE
ncbi:MAG: response regulator [Gaiellaceae bacterium]|jgi:two-component system, OmpR family, response regulator